MKEKDTRTNTQTAARTRRDASGGGSRMAMVYKNSTCDDTGRNFAVNIGGGLPVKMRRGNSFVSSSSVDEMR